MNGSVRIVIMLFLGVFITITIAGAAHRELEKLASAEGRLNTVSMPDQWANWGETWNDLKVKYGITCVDTDMTSAQQIGKIKAEGKRATVDLGDVGLEFASVAKSQSITQPHKPATWHEIPQWAKDPDGHWVLSYTGTIAFIVDKKKVKKTPNSWKELMDSKAKVMLGAVGVGSQPTNAVLAAAIAMGGSESDLLPGVKWFSELAKQKRLLLINPTPSNLEKGEVEVALLWDFNALNYRSLINLSRFDVLIPEEGSVTSGYSTIINKWAKHPNAAKLAREYILSDAGQKNLARGFARPIRNVSLPGGIQQNLLPEQQYKNARTIKNPAAWRKSVRELSFLWQEHVLIHLN